MYIEKVIQIERPISYSLRGFGFLISSFKSPIDGKLCAQVAVVEPSMFALLLGFYLFNLFFLVWFKTQLRPQPI